MIAIYFDDETAVADVIAALGSAGYCLRIDKGRMAAERVPGFLRKDEPRSNVLQMPTRARKARP